MILLDTHVLIWMIEGDARLRPRTRTIIDRERAGDGTLISPISAWETAMLVDKGRIALSRPVADWFDIVLSAQGFCLAELTIAMAADAGALPGAIHADPADRMIVATARSLGCPLLTMDRKILDYAEAGYVQAIDARR